MRKDENNMRATIRNRGDVTPIYISLRKLLASGGMEHYLNLASDRLAENEMIDGEETAINFCDFPDLIFTSNGLFSCRHILGNYLLLDDLTEAYVMLKKAEAHNREVNEMARVFREMKLLQLWTCYQNTKKGSSTEAGKIVREWVKLEVWNRTPIAAIWCKLKAAGMSAYIRMRYYRIFDIVRSCAERI